MPNVAFHHNSSYIPTSLPNRCAIPKSINRSNLASQFSALPSFHEMREYAKIKRWLYLHLSAHPHPHTCRRLSRKFPFSISSTVKATNRQAAGSRDSSRAPNFLFATLLLLILFYINNFIVHLLHSLDTRRRFLRMYVRIFCALTLNFRRNQMYLKSKGLEISYFCALILLCFKIL